MGSSASKVKSKRNLGGHSGRCEDTMTSTLRSTGSGTLPSARASNGNLQPASSDGASEGTPSEEHPEFVDINVVLPNGNVMPITVEYGKQMMDLLVQVAAGNRLSPAAHTIHITNEDTGRPLDYKASQSIGSLKISTIQLVPKKQEKQEKPKSAQPFEKTQRLTVNLPRNQKFVTRVNPKATLAEIYNMVCQEKNMDMYKYELRHPTAPDEALNMASPLEVYGLTEIVVVNIGASENRRPADFLPDKRDVEPPTTASTMPRLKKSSSSTASEEGAASAYMPGQDGARRKKKGVFSFLNKNKKAGSFKLAESTYNEPTYARQQQQQHQQHQQHQHVSQQRTATSPTPSAGAFSNDSRASGSQSPISQDASGPSHVPNRSLPRKKRPAPAPPPPAGAAPAQGPPAPRAPEPAPAAPAAPAPAPAPVAPAAPEPAPPATTVLVTKSVSVDVVSTEPPKPSAAQPQPQVHSRNSSHSSGFDESNVSPLESPGVSTKTDVSEKTQISIDATSVESTETHGKQMKKSQSMPVRAKQGGTEITKSTSLSTFKRKKRKAPAPPAPTGAVKAHAPNPIPEESTISVGGNSSTQDTVVATVTTTTEVITVVEQQAFNHAEIKTSQKTEVHQGPAPSPQSSPSPLDEEDGPVAETSKRVPDLTKDIDDDASSSSGSLGRPRPRPCQFVPPPPPTSPPPPETPVSPDRARSFELITRGVEVVDSSIQVHVSSPRSEDGEFSLSPVSNETFSHGSDSTSENSSLNAYEVNAVLDDLPKSDSDTEDLPLYPNDPDGVVLLKKVSLVESESPPLPISNKAEKEEINERTIRSSLSESSEIALPDASTGREDHVTVISVGGEPDVAGASDSGHSSATLDKSEELDTEIVEPLPEENEITFDDNDVLYVEPLNPGNLLAKEEYHSQVERERIESEASRAEHEEPGYIETPVKDSKYEDPVSTSTPMVQSVTQAVEGETSFAARAPSPVDHEQGRKRHDSSLSDLEDDAFLNGEEPMIALNDYRVVGLIKEEVIDFSYAKHSKPLEIPKKEKEPEQPMVASLRQRYVRRPIVPREPIDIPDLEAMGLMSPRHVLPPPPSEPAPLPPEEPPEPIHIKEKGVVEEKERVYIKPSAESYLELEPLGAEVIEVIEPTDISEQDTELSIPNEAEPETLVRDRAQQNSPRSVVKPVGILKHSSTSSRDSESDDYKVTSRDSFYSDSHVSTSGSPRGILKASSVSSEDSDYHSKLTFDYTRKSSPEMSSRPQGILRNPENSAVSSTSSSRVYSSTTALDDHTEKEEDTKEYKHRIMKNRASLGVYGPRPWGASRPKSETNIIESVNTNFAKEQELTLVKENENVRQRMSEIGFSPNSEREKEDVLEEKSLSMMNLRTNPYMAPETRRQQVGSKENIHEHIDSKRSLQMQYEELQQQFNKWQKQLIDNQALLSQKNITGGEEAKALQELQRPEVIAQSGFEAPEKRVGHTSNYSQNRHTSATIQSTSSAPVRKEPDARYEPKKKTTLDYGGGGKFSTNDLLSAKSRLKSSGDDVEEKGGIILGRVVDAPVSATSRTSLTLQGEEKSSSLPRTAAPSTKDFPAPPRRVLIEPLVANPNPKPIGGVRARFEPKLDPREELMIAIRNNGGRGVLRKVAVAETTWAKPE